MSSANAVGQTIKEIRRGRGLTQDQLAEAAGLSRDAIARIERGDRAPRLSTINAIADGLGVPVEALWSQKQRPVPRAGGRHSARLRRVDRFLADVPDEFAERVVRAIGVLCTPMHPRPRSR